MKKLILTLLLGGFIMTGLSAKTAVVYFSATGTTERMAKSAAQAMGADIFESQNWAGKKMITLCTSGGSGLGRSGTDLSKFAKGVDCKGGKDFTRGSGADVKKYIEGLLK